MIKLNLDVFAYHVQTISTEAAPALLRLSPCEGVNVVIRIEKNSSDWGCVWDSCTVNGENVGNRCGAISAYTRIVKAVSGEIDFS